MLRKNVKCQYYITVYILSISISNIAVYTVHSNGRPVIAIATNTGLVLQTIVYFKWIDFDWVLQHRH